MTPEEFLRFTGVLCNAWPEAKLTGDAVKFYGMELKDSSFASAVAAVRVLGREGKFKIPTAGQIRRKMVELEVDAPGWEEVRRSLNERRAAIERKKGETFTWTCPDGRCDGSGFLVDEEANAARHCGCFQDRLAARRHTVALHPMIQEFLDRGYVTLREVEEVCDTGRRDRSTLEAQMREKWNAYVNDQVSSRAMADLPAPETMKRIERAKGEPGRVDSLGLLGLPRSREEG